MATPPLWKDANRRGEVIGANVLTGIKKNAVQWVLFFLTPAAREGVLEVSGRRASRLIIDGLRRVEQRALGRCGQDGRAAET